MNKVDRREFIKLGTAAVAGLSLVGARETSAAPDKGSGDSDRIEKIDCYSHFSFRSAMEFLEKHEGHPHPFTKLFANTPTLIDADKRVEQMDRNGIAKSVLVPLPWLEMTPKVYNDPKLSSEAAQIINDGMAETAAQYPDRFYAVAVLPTITRDVMMAEYERTVQKNGFTGTLIAVGPTAKYPVHADYESLYQQSEKDNAPIWTHPSRPPTIADFPDQKMSEYNVFQAFSWLLDSTSAMVHIAFKGVFERYPDVKIIVHHHGALVPLFYERLVHGVDFFEKNAGRKADIRVEDPVEHLKKFYVDTATQGLDTVKLRNAIDFFGISRLVFGTDCPMDVKSGDVFIEEAVSSLERLELPRPDLAKIYSGNFLRMIGQA